jgi:hypothetical protein
MASIATGLDYDTKGAKTSSAARMRKYTDDQSGGTDALDAKEAWSRGFSEVLTIRDGNTFDDLLADLRAGKGVHIDVWHAAAGGPCMSGSGGYGHSMYVHPDCEDNKWAVADPWCKPAKFIYWPESKLRAGAEDWGRRVLGRVLGTGGRRWFAPPERTSDNEIWVTLFTQTAKTLMNEWRPGNEAPPTLEPDILFDDETSGPQPIAYTTTAAIPLSGAGGTTDMAVQAVSKVTSNYTCKLSAGRNFYADANLNDQLGELSKETTAAYFGSPIGEEEPGSRMVLLNTGTPYNDKTPRPTFVYVALDACVGGPQPVPPAPTPGDCEVEVADAIEHRDEAWREWLLAGSPGDADST